METTYKWFPANLNNRQKHFGQKAGDTDMQLLLGQLTDK